jgi:hypothetical protein
MSNQQSPEPQTSGHAQEQPTRLLEPLEIVDDASANADQAAEDESLYPQGLIKLLIVASVTLAYVLTSMDSTIVSVVVPSLTDEFHTTRDIGWYSAAYRLCVCSF